MSESTEPTNGNGHAADVQADPAYRALITEWRALESNILLARQSWARAMGFTFDGARDTYKIFGYDNLISIQQYRAKYHRGGIAGRIVDALPNATWRGGMELIEDDGVEKYTPFEQAWIDLDKRLQIQARLLRADKLSQLSNYACLLIGTRDGNLDQELPQSKNDKSLIYLQPYLGGGDPFGGTSVDRALSAGSDITIFDYDIDTKSPRFGLPQTYQLQRISTINETFNRFVHWTRIIHIAEGCLDDDVFGLPSLERVWNLIADLEKVTSGGAEAFWLRANQGFLINVDKDMALSPTKDEMTALKDQVEAYKHNLDRWIRTRGVNVDVLGSDVANFQNPADAILTQIAGAKGIPKRILTGSEMGELASSQDRDNWADQIHGRQTQYAGPYIARQLADRLIQYGYLPTPAKGVDAYEVQWEHIQTLTETEKSAGAQAWATVNATSGMTVFTDAEIRDKWYAMEPTEQDQEDTQPWRSTLALKMAEVNKTQGAVIFTDDEIRKTCFEWEPLTPAQKVPLTAPERVSAPAPTPEIDAQGNPMPAKPVGAPGQPAPPEAKPTNKLKAAAEGYKLSSTQVQLPMTLAVALLAFGKSIPEFDRAECEEIGEDWRETDPHVTVKYGIHTNNADEVRAALPPVPAPLSFTLGRTNFFSADKYDVLYVEVFSPDLVAMNDWLSTHLENTNTQATYIPHATVAYLKRGLAKRYMADDALLGMSAEMSSIRFSPAEGEDTDLPLRVLSVAGGQGSGNFGHAGRPGAVGGSGEGGSMTREGDSMTHDESLLKRGFSQGDIDSVKAYKARMKEVRQGYRTEAVKYEKVTGLPHPMREVFKREGDPLPPRGAKPVQQHLPSDEDRFGRVVDDTRLTDHRGRVVSPEELDKHPDVEAGRRIQNILDMVDGLKYDNPNAFSDLMKLFTPKIKAAGGAGSGNFGHAGRPGEVGGSGEGGGAAGSATGTTPPWHSAGGWEHTGIVWKQEVDPRTGRPVPIRVSDVNHAAALVLQGQVVEVPDVQTAHTLITKLADMAADAQAKGEKAPQYDLCHVSVSGTNMFCAESIRTPHHPEGWSRLEMPQFGGEPVPGSEADKLPRTPWNPKEVNGADAFITHLQGLGIRTTSEIVPAAQLKASQREMEGQKVAAIMRDKTFDPTGPKNPLFVSSDNYVVDGHHRWAAAVGRDAEDGKLGSAKATIYRLNAPIAEVLHLGVAWSQKYGIKQAAALTAQAKETGLHKTLKGSAAYNALVSEVADAIVENRLDLIAELLEVTPDA
jgi:2'-5' RNA ligase